MSISERLLVVIDADVKGAIREVDKLGTSAEQSSRKAQSGMDKFASASIKAGTAMIGASVAVGIGLSKTVGAAQEAAIAQEKLKNTIARIPELAGANVRAFNAQALALQRVTVANDEEINAAQAMLGTFHLTERQILKLTPLVLDYARKFDTDLVSASKQVGKAMQGQIGALQRNGIILDKTAYATDKYSAIVKALRENAGGFAEKEGKTFGGQLQILKNQASELEESIGRGVVGTLTEILPAANKAAQGLGSIDEASGNMIGKFATIGTIASGAVGGVLLIAGAVAKVKTAMEESAVAATAFKGIGIGAGVIGGFTAFVGVVELLKKAFTDTRTAAEKAADASKTATSKLVADFTKAAAESNRYTDASVKGLEKLAGGTNKTAAARAKQLDAERKYLTEFRGLAENNIGTATRLFNALKKNPEAADAAGISIGKLGAILRSTAAGQRQANADTERGTKATRDNTKATTDNAEALDKRRAALLATFNSELAAAQSTQSLSETLKNSQDPLEKQAALLAAAGDKAQSMADRLAAAGVDVDSATVKNDLFRQALQELGNQFPELQGLVNDYIGRLNSIPPNKSTTIDANTAPADSKIANLAAKLALISKQTITATLGPLFGGGRAAGGPVDKNRPYLVGEKGPEIFVPNGNGRILNARDSAAKLQAVGAGGGGNTYNVYWQSPGSPSAEDGRRFVEGIRAYERNSGSRWRQN